MIKRNDQGPEAHKIANTKSTTSIETTVQRKKKSTRDRIAPKTETGMNNISTIEIEIVGAIMIVTAIGMTSGETDRIEIMTETIEDRETAETSIGGNKKKLFNKKILISSDAAKFSV